MDSEVTFFKIAQKTKTPLAVVGIIVVVLYFIAKVILKTERFSTNNTLILLSSVLSYLFWLGLAALVASVLCFIIAKHYGKPSKMPEVSVDQKVNNAKKVSGVIAHEMKNGKIVVDQDVEEAEEVVGARIDKIGDK